MNRKRSLHGMLTLRIVLVAAIVSVAVSALVVHKEAARDFQVAQDRALIRTGTLQVLTQDLLDAPDLGDHARLQQMLKATTYKGFDLGDGHYVLARVLDPTLDEVARAEDPEFEDMDSLARQVGAAPVRLSGDGSGPEFTEERIAGRRYVRALVPLSSRQGRTVAWVEGYFTPTPEQQRAALLDLLCAIGLAVGTVLATSLLLYPVIIRLMRRMERLSLNLLDANLEMVGVVGRTIAKRDSDTDAHNFRVTIYSVHVAQALGLDEAMIRTLIKGAFLHDVGKIGVRDSILLKPGKLDETEIQEMQKHVRHGLDIVDRAVWLKEASEVVGNHHEKYGGDGYPAGLRGEQIPVLARIFAIADVFDALMSRRPYKEALGYDETVDILEKGRGSHFDPAILDQFLKISRSLSDQYHSADGDRAHADLDAIVHRYFGADVATFLDLQG